MRLGCRSHWGEYPQNRGGFRAVAGHPRSRTRAERFSLVAVPLEEFVHFTHGPVHIFVDVVQAHVRSTAHFVQVFGFAGGVVVSDGQEAGVFQGFFSIDAEIWV